jgi:REP-associated tyrosine transposase
MARPLRLEFPGAIYHITARGNARELIFHDETDRETFLDALSETVARFVWHCHAYCLMDNHYHLLVETPEGNLSRGMRQLNGVYTQRFNRRHGHVGHVLQGRFKSILVERDSYLLELARYIVLNPIRAKAVNTLSRYRWSSYLATAGSVAPPTWLTTDWILEQFARTRVVAQRRYARFVAEGKNRPSPWPALQGQVLLGSERYIEKMRPILEGKGELKEIPRAQRLAHRPALKELFPARVRGDKRMRDEAIRKACLEYGYSMAAIAKHADIHYSTVSKVIKGVR